MRQRLGSVAAARRADRAVYRARLARRQSVRAGAAHPAVAPLAPAGFPDLPAIDGVRLATAATGLRYRGRDDVLLVELAPGTAVAGVTTRSVTRSAAVEDVAAKLGSSPAHQVDGAAFLVNAGNANAFTGAEGAAAVARLANATAAATGVPAARVFTASTGVIGEPLRDGAIAASLARLAETVAPGGFEAAARAIMTTDTFPKGATATAIVGSAEARVVGIAKGSGMIAPDMATMLAFIFTDAAVAPATLRRMLTAATDRSFNRITVDSDTSTSDTVLLGATGQGAARVPDTGPDADAFASALFEVTRDLAHQIVLDGEGARKFVTVRVTGAVDIADARRVARAIADSPLVKTAIAGEDPNWGRVVMAVGKAGASADRDRLTIRFGPHLLAEAGRRAQAYDESVAAAYMRRAEIEIAVDLGLGSGSAEMWTCDLTDGYIRINADYRS